MDDSEKSRTEESWYLTGTIFVMKTLLLFYGKKIQIPNEIWSNLSKHWLMKSVPVVQNSSRNDHEPFHVLFFVFIRTIPIQISRLRIFEQKKKIIRMRL